MAAGASYNGWPANSDPNAIGIDKNFSVAGVTFPGGVKSGDVSTIFTYLITRLHTEVEPLVKGWSWGYEYRANVNNPSTLSCHASGTAIDYNAPNHANGTSTGPSGGGGWSGAQYTKIKAILAACGGSVAWLTNNDPMHFEISGSALKLSQSVANLGGISVPSKPSGDTGQSTPTAPTTPATPAVPTEEEEIMGAADDIIKKLSPLQIVVADDSDTNAVFAYGPGRFFHVDSPEALAVGQDLGLFSRDLRHANRRALDVIQYVSLYPNLTTQASALATAAANKTWTVQSGQTFGGIAQSLGTTVDALKAANPQVSNIDNIEIGQVLNVPK